jgi:ATP-binding cassette subfamily B protein
MIEIRDQNRGKYLSGFLGASAIAVATSIAFYALFARVLRGFLAGALTIGDVAVFGTVGLRLRGALETAVLSVSGALGQTLYIANLREFLSLPSRPSGPPGRTPATTRGEIEYRGVSFTYSGADAPALVDVSLRIRAGETVALVGRNGAGKTTLVKLLGRFYEPGAGSVAFDGTDVRELAGEYLRRRIAFVFQDPVPYEATAADNIAYGDWRRLLADRERVEQVARQAGVDRLIAALPRGYDTRLGRLFSEHDLSIGEWQQLAIARALAREASVLILDEPTASLDAVAEYELFKRFRELARGRTTILISHRFSTVRMADRIIVLARGRVVETGSHEELLAGGGYYAELYAAHARQTARPLSDAG